MAIRNLDNLDRMAIEMAARRVNRRNGSNKALRNFFRLVREWEPKIGLWCAVNWAEDSASV